MHVSHVNDLEAQHKPSYGVPRAGLRRGDISQSPLLLKSLEMTNTDHTHRGPHVA
jgi:hypothetical protein